MLFSKVFEIVGCCRVFDCDVKMLKFNNEIVVNGELADYAKYSPVSHNLQSGQMAQMEPKSVELLDLNG